MKFKIIKNITNYQCLVLHLHYIMEHITRSLSVDWRIGGHTSFMLQGLPNKPCISVKLAPNFCPLLSSTVR